jgi:hypothetical protein
VRHDDLDAIVDNDLEDRATTFCVHASSSGTTYKINHTIVLKEGETRYWGSPDRS